VPGGKAVRTFASDMGNTWKIGGAKITNVKVGKVVEFAESKGNYGVFSNNCIHVCNAIYDRF